MLSVIANQSSDWCGNPYFPFQKIRILTPVCALAQNDRYCTHFATDHLIFGYMERAPSVITRPGMVQTS